MDSMLLSETVSVTCLATFTLHCPMRRETCFLPLSKDLRPGVGVLP